jgi:hypothetical protein
VVPAATDEHQSLLKFLFLAFFAFFEGRGWRVWSGAIGDIGLEARILGRR